jgi:hypothetical protein
MINNHYHAYGVLNISLKLTTNPRKTSTFQLWLNHHASCEFSTMRFTSLCYIKIHKASLHISKKHLRFSGCEMEG